MRKEELSIHSVHQTIKDARIELVSIIEARSSVDVDLDEQIQQLDYLLWCISQSEPSLLFARMLDQIDARIKDLLSYLQNSPIKARETPEQAEILTLQVDASNYLSQAIEYIQYPRQQRISSLEANEAISEVRASARSAISSIRQLAATNHGTLKDEIQSIREILEREQKSLDKQSELVSALQQSTAEHKAAISSDAAAKAAVFDGLILDRRSQLEGWAEDLNKKGGDYLAKIEQFYGLTASTTLSGRFELAAREENASYWINLILAVSFFLAAIISVMIETWWVPHTLGRLLSDPLFVWLGKISLVAVCIVPASIFATQATKHRRASTWYKTVGVRIATLKPYLSEFEGDYTVELKDILKSFFVSEIELDGGRRKNSLPTMKEVEAVTGCIAKAKELLKIS